MLAILILLAIAFIINIKKVSAQQNNVSFQVFYDQLSPYGQWVDNPDYGYVWMPDAGPDFVPYSSGGRWIMSDYGWTWYSSYDWGWAPFHYGRWGYDSYYGWFWVPGGEWGPAWVNWRSSEGYYGWAPMEPGVTISFALGMNYNRNDDHWIFIRDRYIGSSDMNRYYANSGDHDRIIRNSRIITNTYSDNRKHLTYVSGPAREDVQRITGVKVRAVGIKESNKPGQDMSNGQLHFYRPQVSRNSDPEHRSAPSKIARRGEAEQAPSGGEINLHRNAAPPADNRGRQPDRVVPARNTPNFNNTYKINDAVNKSNSNNGNNGNNTNNSVKTNNFKNNVRRNNGNPGPGTKAKTQQDASQSDKTVTEKRSSPSSQPDKNGRQSQRKSRSDKNKK